MFERLIEKCADGEGNDFERFIGRSFLENRISKRSRELRMLNDSLQTLTDLTPPTVPENLWEKFSQRVSQEQYAETFLGKRPQEPKKRFSFAEIFSPGSTALPWATLGGATAVILLSFVGTGHTPIAVPANAYLAPLSSSEVQPVVASNARSPSAVPVSFDVDWVRSQGKVNISRSANDKTPIFWVSKKAAPQNMPQATPYLKVGKAFPAKEFPQ